MTPNTAKTSDYDPRYDRAQTVEGAKARYVEGVNGYDEADLERDLDRIIRFEGEYPDREGPYTVPVPTNEYDMGEGDV